MNTIYQLKLDELEAEKVKIRSQKIYTHNEMSDVKTRFSVYGFLVGFVLMYVIVRLFA